MDKLYQRINYENSPSKKTPLNKTNLDKMDKALDDLDNRIIEQDAAFAKSIATEDEKIEEVSDRVSGLTETAAALAQSKSPAIICSTSGTTIIATDSAEAEFEEFRTLGWSTQETIPGNQLANLPDVEEVVVNGITWSCKNGAVTAKGTATNISAPITAGIKYVIPIIAGTYIASGSSDDGVSVYVSIKDADGNVTYKKNDYFTLDGTEQEVVIYCQVHTDKTVDTTIYPMLNAGTEALPWEPYCGGQASPNPEYPQPIVGAGQKLALGNQLFDYTGLEQGSLDNGANSESTTIYRCAGFVECNANSNYTFSGLASNVNVRMFYYDSNKTYLSTALATNGTFTTPANCAYFRYHATYEELTETIMLNAGTTALPWEPYTGGVKKAYDVGIEHKLTGKNLLKNTLTTQTRNNASFTVNEDKTITVNGTPNAETLLYFHGSPSIPNVTMPENINIGDTIVLSGGANSNVYLELLCSNGTTWTLSLNSKSAEVKGTIPEDTIGLFVRLRVTNGYTAQNALLKPMIRKCDENGTPIGDDTYEPYTEQTLTLNRVLNAIPVTDSSLATYTDENGQMWCADYVDAERGVLVKRVEKVVLNGSENWYINDANGDPYRNATLLLSGIIQNGDSVVANISNIYCDSYIAVSPSNTWHCIKGIAVSTEGAIYIYDENYNTSDISLWTAHLAENPITVQYILATPIETALTDEEIIAYKALHTNKPTTVITNDAGCMMAIEYVADPKNHIQQNYVPVSKYTALEERVAALEQLHV